MNTSDDDDDDDNDKTHVIAPVYAWSRLHQQKFSGVSGARES